MEIYNTYFGKNILMVIPDEYKNTYDVLLKKLANYGKDLLDDCSSTCKSANKQLTICWNMFQAACAAYQIGDTKKADLLIKYINTCMKVDIANLITMYVGQSDYVDNITEEKVLTTFLNVLVPITGEFSYISDVVDEDVFAILLPKDLFNDVELTIVDEFETDTGTLGWNDYEEERYILINDKEYRIYSYKAPPSSQRYKVSVK